MSRNLELLERAERDAQLRRSVLSHQNSEPGPPGLQQAETASPSRYPCAQLAKGAERQLSALVENLFMSQTANAPRLVGFCGVDTEAGSSWITACLAEMLTSRISGDLCLIDANVCNPSVHDHFGLENPYGLVEAVRDRRGLLRYLRWLSKKLALLSCGMRVAEKDESLGIDPIRSCFADLRATFDYLLINLGSAATSRDAFLLSQCMDGVVLVVEANATRRVLAHETKLAFETAGANLLGAILHNRDFAVPKAIDSILQRFA